MDEKRLKELEQNSLRKDVQKKIVDGMKDATEAKVDVFLRNKEASNRAKFSQLIIENMQYILNRHPDYLSTAEHSTLLKLFSLTTKYFNKIVKYEKRSGYGYKSTAQNATIKDIAEFINVSRTNLSKNINSLIKKGLVIEDKDEIIEDKNDRKTNAVALYINPEICYSGDRNNIHGKLCRYIKDNDILEENNIHLPWKCWVEPKARDGKLYKRGTYNKKSNKHKLD